MYIAPSIIVQDDPLDLGDPVSLRSKCGRCRNTSKIQV
jgi:hypothetical protein